MYSYVQSGDQSKRVVLLDAVEGSASTLEATSSNSYFKVCGKHGMLAASIMSYYCILWLLCNEQSPKQMSPSVSVSDLSCKVNQCCHFFYHLVLAVLSHKIQMHHK